MKKKGTREIVKPLYFANWSDMWGFPIAHAILPYAAKLPFLTPNMISIVSFFLYLIGSISLFIEYPYHLVVSAVLLIVAFIGDDLDGQVARYRNLSSVFGDFLDKVLDVTKIFILTASLSYAVYNQTQQSISIYVGFAAGFFFMVRYYIKLETMFSVLSRDTTYLEKSAEKRKVLTKELDSLHTELKKTFWGRLRSFWLTHRLIFTIDEGEFVFVTAVCALLNKLEVALWILAVSQVSIACLRFIERSYQLHTNSEKLLLPMRK